jgi:hypothetical protein
MEENKDNLTKENKAESEKHYWRPVMVFYAKSTAWVIFPLILALLVNRYFSNGESNQSLMLAFLMAGFGLTCFGIYKEIKKYKKTLDK